MKWLNIVLIVLFFVYLTSFTFTTNTDFNQDLGRHLKIGELILNGTIPKTNLFSYTNPDFPFINHHWLGEALFYVLTSLFSVTSLIYLKQLLTFAAVGIVLFLAIKRSSVPIAICSAFLFSPLLIERSYIRPELFGYVFFGFLLFILYTYPKYPKLLYTLPLVMLLWVNIHITFVFGIVLLVLLIIRIYTYKLPVISKHKHSTIQTTLAITKRNLFVAAGSILIVVINPNFIQGALYPFFIFNNYGYSIVENQNLFFLTQLTGNPFIRYFFLLSPIVLFSVIFLLVKKKYFESGLLTIFFCLAIYQIRHFPFFVLVAIPTIAEMVFLVREYIKINEQLRLISKLLIGLILVFSALFFANNGFFMAYGLDRTVGTTVYEHGKNAADFLLDHNLPGPIFNNFDVGGYAIYRLYPKYKVFVDNRPEAYPADFMQSVYEGLQLNPNIRKTVFDKYQIKTIFFAHTDQTPWASAFTSSIIKDPEWKLVYLDSYIMILTKDSTLPDIRNNIEQFKSQITQESNDLKLLRYAALFSLWGGPYTELANIAFDKAYSINPLSCSMRKFIISRTENDPMQYYKAQEMKSNSWYCF